MKFCIHMEFVGKMKVVFLRTVLILTFLAVLFGGSDAWWFSRRRCASHSCTWRWGSCSRTCGGGTQSPYKTGSQGACGSCNLPSTRSCNTQCCRENCQWRTWNSWGSCTNSCGGGTQIRTRAKSSQRCGGSACSGSSVDTRSCNQLCCPVHCAWTSWNSWGSCSQSCGGGVQSRNRGYNTIESCGGNSCPGSSVETRSCSQNCCPVKCVWNPWSDWNGCSRSCGGGTQTRMRGFSVLASCNGTSCLGNSTEQQSCNSHCCPVNCTWAPWGQWADCSVSCGGGSKSRNRGHYVEMSCGGIPCSGSATQSSNCNDQCCPVDCAWTKWGQWGSCSDTCGGGTQVRQRGEDPVKECGGNSCVGSANDQKVCNTQCCPFDCVWGTWSDWDACTTSCGGGTQERRRSISIPSFCGGNQCLGDKLEFQDCNSQCCPVDCKWGAWEEWGVCSKSCERGTQTRSRDIAIEAFCAGNQCLGTYNDTRFCNDVCCPVHCQWAEWSIWSTCTKTCETGTQYHERVVKVDAVCSGEICEGPTRVEQQCNSQCCPVDCVLTTWTHWTECSHTCGAKGSQNRHRNITQETFCGGKLCEPNHFETRVCNAFCFNNGSLGTDACLCPVGWKGDCCQEDENECEYVNCTENSVCFNTFGSFECICNHGYTKIGRNCSDIDECHLRLHDCHKMAQCINLEGNYTCECDPGFTGNGTTCTDIDECVLESNYYYSGDYFDYNSFADTPKFYISSPLCHEEATCFNTYGRYNCQCNKGYVGDGVHCQDLDECSLLAAAEGHLSSESFDASNWQNFDNRTLVPCDIHATCFNMQGSYSCWCKAGYFGDGISCTEINECDSDPCTNGGTCDDKVDAFSCTCPAGYMGKRCEMDKDECLFNAFHLPIEGSGGEKEASGFYVGSGNDFVCHDRATCTNTFGSYICTCNRGFVGDGFSCSDLDECAIDAGVEASSGREDASDVRSFQPCSKHAVCSNSIGNYTCACNDGYSGNGFACVEIDECLSNPCKNGGTCTDHVNGFRCQCGGGYIGTNCEIDIHECKEGTHLCDPKNARCINTDGSHECVCKYGYTGDGKTCVDINECKENTHLCEPINARCINNDGSHECECKYGHTGDGKTCFDLDECKIGSDDCNEKTQLCQNQNGGFLCVCKDGYEIQNGECKELVSDDDHGKQTHKQSSLQQFFTKPAGIASIILGVLLLVAVTVLVIKLYQRRRANAGQYRAFIDTSLRSSIGSNLEVSDTSRRNSFGTDEVSEEDTIL